MYILFLNRFEKDMNVLKKKLSSLGINVLSFTEKLLVVEGKNIEKSLALSEISGVAKIVSDWKSLDFEKLKKDALSAMQDSNKKAYKIKTKFHDKTSFSSRRVYKTVNPSLKKENYTFNEDNPEVILYIEFKKENKKVFSRVSYSFPEWLSSPAFINVDYSNFVIVLENPAVAEEISDFLRICWIFKIPLYIIPKNTDFDKLLNKAKKITKGIDYTKMKLTISKKIPEGYLLAGFSKLAKENEMGLEQLLSTSKKIALVFGDDKFGLTQEARDKMNRMFRLTPEIKKPLRASHALSYVLGIYTSLKISPKG